MADETFDKVESQKTTTEDEKTQIDADKKPDGGDAGKKPDSADPHGTKKEDETQEQFYQRQLKEKDELIKRREGEAHNYRKEAQELREKVREKQPEQVEEKKPEAERPKTDGEADKFRELRIEMALGSIKDPNKKKLVELELRSLNFGESAEEVMAAVDRAEAIVDAPYLRRAAMKRGSDHAQDVEAASFSDHGTHSRGDRSERALHPEAAATIAEARRQMPKSK